MVDILDLEHPAITSALRLGYPRVPDDDWPYCPYCGEAADTFFRRDGKIIGCPECIETADAWEVLEDG